MSDLSALEAIARQFSYEAIRDDVIDPDDAKWLAGMALDALRANGYEVVKRLTPRVIETLDEQGKFPPKEWGARSEALRNDYRANARALLAAGLLADGGEKA